MSELLVAGEEVNTRGVGGGFLRLRDAALDRSPEEKPLVPVTSRARLDEAVVDECVSIGCTGWKSSVPTIPLGSNEESEVNADEAADSKYLLA